MKTLRAQQQQQQLQQQQLQQQLEQLEKQQLQEQQHQRPVQVKTKTPARHLKSASEPDEGEAYGVSAGEKLQMSANGDVGISGQHSCIETQRLLPIRASKRGRPLTCQVASRERSFPEYEDHRPEHEDHEPETESECDPEAEARLLTLVSHDEHTLPPPRESEEFCSKSLLAASLLLFLGTFLACRLVASLQPAINFNMNFLHGERRAAWPPPDNTRAHNWTSTAPPPPAFCRLLPRGPWPPECENYSEDHLGFGEVGGVEPHLDFEPVNGGVNRLCRGVTETDNSDGYYEVVPAKNLEHCKAACATSPTCLGIEFMSRDDGSSPHCELWTRAVETSAPGSKGFTCLRFNPLGFEPVVDDSARRAEPPAGETTLHDRVSSLYVCKSLCVSAQLCRGIEYEPVSMQCRVWSLALGPGLSDPRPGGLVRLTRTLPGFEPLGAPNQCRGNSAAAESHLVPSLEECKAKCFITPLCTGIKHFSGNCVLWKGLVHRLQPIEGVTCFTFKRPKPASSLFCVALAGGTPQDLDLELLRAQRKQRAGIFGCDEWTVYSGQDLSLGDGARTKLLRLSSPHAPFFDEFWIQIVADGRFRSHGWVVKVDPAAVFIPGRLRLALHRNIMMKRLNTGRGVFLTACADGQHEGGHLSGPLEALSSSALEVWATGHLQCRRVGRKPTAAMELEHCLHDVLGVAKQHLPDLLAKEGCGVQNWMDCTTNHVAFYDFKTTWAQERCIGMIEATTPHTFGFGKLHSNATVETN
jgi:hypothetical protein